MFNTRQLGRTCKATLTGISISVTLSGCPPKTEPKQPSAVVSKQLSISEKTQDRSEKIRMLLGAVMSGDINEARSLIDKGTNMDERDDNGATPMMVAVLSRHGDVAKMLIDKGAKVDAKDNHGGTPLEYAILGLQEDVAKLLIDRGAKVNEKSDNGDTLLMIAARNEDTGVAKLLIAHGVDVNARDKQGWTALMYAVWGGRNEVDWSDLLKLKRQELSEASNELERRRQEHEEGAEYMDIRVQSMREDIRVSEGNFNLFKRNNRKTIELLIANGADPNLKDKNGKTALTIAMDNHEAEMANLLRRHGAK